MKRLILACLLGVTWPAGEIILTDEGAIEVVRLPDGSGVVVYEYPNDPWVYDAELAPYDTPLLGVYNGETPHYESLLRTKSRGWISVEPSYYTGETNTVKDPDAWLEIPKPKNLVKLVDGYTKEQLVEKLKEFNE